MKTSHPNLKYHNWLIYKANDHFLQKNAARLRGRLYDLGCGEAPYRDLFMHYAEEYVGVDWSDSYHKTEADIIADLNKPLPIESDVADTVVSLSVLEHLYNPQLMLCEAFRILKRGGASCFRFLGSGGFMKRLTTSFDIRPMVFDTCFRKLVLLILLLSLRQDISLA